MISTRLPVARCSAETKSAIYGGELFVDELARYAAFGLERLDSA